MKREGVYPALTAWERRERGKPSSACWVFDDLWRAACEERNAIEAAADELRVAYVGNLGRARRFVLQGTA